MWRGSHRHRVVALHAREAGELVSLASHHVDELRIARALAKLECPAGGELNLLSLLNDLCLSTSRLSLLSPHTTEMDKLGWRAKTLSSMKS